MRTPSKLAFLASCVLSALPFVAASGEECTFRPAGARGTYDLTPLRRPSNYEIKLPDSSKVYLLNFCGTLADDDYRAKYSCDARASVCEGMVAGSGVGKSLGTATGSTVKVMESIVKYTFYNGDSCPSQLDSKLKTFVLLTCSDGKDADAAPIFNREENCEYIFKMKTPSACLVPDKNNDPATPSVKCTTSAPNGDTYDLTNLARQKTDWFVTTLETDYQWYLNLCHDINDVSTDKCRSGSSACVTKRSDPTYWKSIGRTLDTQLVFSEEKGLSVVMNGGETCRGGNYRVVIDFVCTPDSVNMGKPIYTDDDPEDCVHQFTWMSRYGCPTRPAETSCVSDYADLAPLRRTGEGMNWEIQNQDLTYYLNVCGPLQPSSRTSKCTASSAICRIKESSSAIEATSLGSHGTLSNAGGVTMYQFEDGDFCNDQARHRTYIHMLCNEKVGKGKPVIVGNFDGCLTMMEWETAYACPKKVIGFWSVFLWTSFCLLIAYVILGIAYKRFVLGLRGFEQIPLVHLWRKAWSKITRSHEYNIVL